MAAPAFITQLVKDTTYYYRLVAENQFGKSTGTTYTFRTTVGTPAPVGSAPTVKTLTASGVSRTAATVNGEVTPNRSSTRYWFEYGTSGNFGLITDIQSVGDGTAKLPASLLLSNLAPATTYYFRLNAQNNFGTVNGTILTFTTAGPADLAVPVVTTQIPESIATTSAILRGTVNPTGLQTTYWFEYSTNAGFSAATLKTTPEKSLAAAAVTLSAETTVTGLQSNTTYFYRMVAQNSAGTSRGSSQTFKTK